MQERNKLWALMGFAVTALLGTLLHFLYEWLGEAAWIAPFSAVNESTWEHMKLLYWPMLLFAVIQFAAGGVGRTFWCVALRGMLRGLAAIPLLFYTFNGVIGPSSAFWNIAIFFIAAAIAYRYEAKQLSRADLSCRASRLALLCLVAIGFLFLLFTFATPHLAIFRDPLTGHCGRIT